MEGENTTTDELRRMVETLEAYDGTMRIVDLREHQELADKLRPYQCSMCFKYIIEGEEGKDFITTRTRVSEAEVLVSRWHPDCKAKRDEQAEEFQRRNKEQKEHRERIVAEQQSGKIPYAQLLHMRFYGKKPDFERFVKAAKRLADEHNLLASDDDGVLRLSKWRKVK